MPGPSIALVGPVPPWRSGIADQTIRLARALKGAGADVRVVTFRRMYPRFLYPGEADRDAREFPKDLDVAPLLDGFWPPSFQRAARTLAKENVDAVVLPWWTAFFSPHDLLFLKTLERTLPRAVRVVYAHNVVDHEASAWKKRAALSVFRRAHRVVVQNRSSELSLPPLVAPVPVSFLPHPAEAEAPPVARDEARKRLGLPHDAPLFLFAGILRPYKGWDVLLEAFSRVVENQPNALLVFAGEPWGEARATLEKPRANVRAVLRYLDAAERGLYLDAADAVVCPYRHASGSGIAADALAHARPVIGTRVDGLVDVLTDGVDSLLVPPEDVSALADAMTRFVRESLGPTLARGAESSRERFSPEGHARALLDLVEKGTG